MPPTYVNYEGPLSLRVDSPTRGLTLDSYPRTLAVDVGIQRALAVDEYESTLRILDEARTLAVGDLRRSMEVDH